MPNIIASIIFAILLGTIQTQLWSEQGSIAELTNIKEKLQEQEKANKTIEKNNQILQEQINDLQNGLELIEEKARYESGYIKSGEIFIQITN